MTACSSPTIDPQGAVIIDVRAPEEFAAGHLEGARNINFYDEDFAAQVAALDHGASYILYCKSGVRAGKALDIMQAQGFTHLVNAGGLEDAAQATGVAIVS